MGTTGFFARLRHRGREHFAGGVAHLSRHRINEGAPSFRVFCERVGTTDLDDKKICSQRRGGPVLHTSQIEGAPSFDCAQDRFSRVLCEKWDDERCGGNELGSEDQDFGRGKDIVDQNPLLLKPGRSGAPLVLPTRSGPPARVVPTSGGLGVEQFSPPRNRLRRISRDRVGVDGTNARKSSKETMSIRGTAPLKPKTRLSGPPANLRCTN